MNNAQVSVVVMNFQRVIVWICSHFIDFYCEFRLIV